MKKQLLFLFSFTFSFLFAQKPEDANLLVPDAYTIDLGTFSVRSGAIRHEFHFTNKGKVPLIITNGNTNDGGSMIEYPREPIAPGQTITIIFFQDTQWSRHFSREIILWYSPAGSTDSKRDSQVVVEVTGIIQ